MDAPVFRTGHIEFSVLAAEQKLTVIRLDPIWQKRDVIFLHSGQSVEIYGELCDNFVVAKKIVIIDDPERPYIEDEEIEI